MLSTIACVPTLWAYLSAFWGHKITENPHIRLKRSMIDQSIDPLPWVFVEVLGHLVHYHALLPPVTGIHCWKSLYDSDFPNHVYKPPNRKVRRRSLSSCLQDAVFQSSLISKQTILCNTAIKITRYVDTAIFCQIFCTWTQ